MLHFGPFSCRNHVDDDHVEIGVDRPAICPTERGYDDVTARSCELAARQYVLVCLSFEVHMKL